MDAATIRLIHSVDSLTLSTGDIKMPERTAKEIAQQIMALFDKTRGTVDAVALGDFGMLGCAWRLRCGAEFGHALRNK